MQGEGRGGQRKPLPFCWRISASAEKEEIEELAYGMTYRNRSFLSACKSVLENFRSQMQL